MSFLIKVVLSFCLFVQFSFAGTKLIYQERAFKKYVEYLSSEPTLDDVAKSIALGRMDASLLKTIRTVATKQGLSGSTRLPKTELVGNRITIDGLKKPIIIGNSEKLELSYDGEKIVISKPGDFEQTVKDIEVFFQGKSVQFDGKKNSFNAMFIQMAIGEKAQAAIIFAILLGIILLGAAAMAWMMPGADESWKTDWPFNPDSVGKGMEFKCIDGKFTMLNGSETISFDFHPRNVENGRIATDGRDISIFPGYSISYSSTKGKVRSGTMIYDTDFGLVASSKSRFAEPDFTLARKTTLIEAAKVILGEDGKRKICNGNEFADGNAGSFKELSTHFSKVMDEKRARKVLPSHLKQMDKLPAGERVK